MSLVWAGVEGFPAYKINQYGEVRYVETDTPVPYSTGLGEMWYQLISQERVVYLRSSRDLLAKAFPVNPISSEKVGLLLSELSPRQLRRARYGGPRGGHGGQLGRAV